MSPTQAQISTATKWLVEKGYVEPRGNGVYDLTEDGQAWMLWAVWVSLGCPGMSDEVYAG